MTAEAKRKLALEQIQQNINRDGHHIYVVSGPPTPRFAYTIGLSPTVGFELILAGAISYMLNDVITIINGVARELKVNARQRQVRLEGGSFMLRSADRTWTSLLLLGAFDFYQSKEIPVLQIVPDQTHWTSDIPPMNNLFCSETSQGWQHLREPWNHPVPEDSMATTNLAALRGERITEATRWESDYWELFAGDGPAVRQEDTRVVPLETLLAADKSLTPILRLSIGKGLWRDETSAWHPWDKTND
jgi:hypothetical protein